MKIWVLALFDFLGLKKSCVRCHKSNVHDTCHMSHVICHLQPVINANSHTPSPADSPLIHSRLVPDSRNPYLFMDKNVVKIVVSFEPIMQLWCPSRLRKLWIIPSPPYFMKKDEKHDTLGLSKEEEKWWRTDIHTDMANLWPTRPRGPSRWKNKYSNNTTLNLTYL